MLRIFEIIVDLIKFIIPKFHNKIKALIVFSGIGL